MTHNFANKSSEYDSSGPRPPIPGQEEANKFKVNAERKYLFAQFQAINFTDDWQCAKWVSLLQFIVVIVPFLIITIVAQMGSQPRHLTRRSRRRWTFQEVRWVRGRRSQRQTEFLFRVRRLEATERPREGATNHRRNLPLPEKEFALSAGIYSTRHQEWTQKQGACAYAGSFRSNAARRGVQDQRDDLPTLPTVWHLSSVCPSCHRSRPNTRSINLSRTVIFNRFEFSLKKFNTADVARRKRRLECWWSRCRCYGRRVPWSK